MRWNLRYSRRGFQWFQEGRGRGTQTLLDAVEGGMRTGSSPWAIILSPRNYKAFREENPGLDLPIDGGRARFSFGEGLFVPTEGFAGLAVVAALRNKTAE